MSASMVEPPKSLDELVRPHVDSFDYFTGEGLQTVVDLLKPVEVKSLLPRPVVGCDARGL